MKQTEILIVGASISGLAVAAALQKRNIACTIIEKETQAAAPWRNHYQRLHLHTNKRISNLPYKKFDHNIPRYPSRWQVIAYLENYQQAFNIHPIFNTKAINIWKEKEHWITETTNGTFQSNYVIIATGAFGKPRPIILKGMDTFTGSIIHSSNYKTGKDYKGQQVLVIGFGNSACEIAIDLYEQGAMSSMSVRGAVNIIPRDLLGIPILEISQWLSRLPTRVADAIAATLMRLQYGDITRLGLQKMQYGPFKQIQKNKTIPVLDIGVIKHIKQRHIEVYAGIDYIEGDTVYFKGGKHASFDAIVAAIGYDMSIADIINLDKSRLEDLQLETKQQQYFGKDGLYACGFWISATGHIKAITSDAQRIAKDIAKKRQHRYM